MRTAKKIRYRLEWLGLKFATKFVPLLSRKACYRLGLLLGAMLDRRGRRVALSNLRVAFGDEISSERRAQIVRESYQHFARTMLDFFWSPRLTSHLHAVAARDTRAVYIILLLPCGDEKRQNPAA